MKKLCSKTLKTLINEWSRPVHKRKASQKRAICILYFCIAKYTNTEKVEIFHVLHNQGALLMKRRSEWGTRNCHQVIFRKVWTIHKENVDQKMNLL